MRKKGTFMTIGAVLALVALVFVYAFSQILVEKSMTIVGRSTEKVEQSQSGLGVVLEYTGCENNPLSYPLKALIGMAISQQPSLFTPDAKYHYDGTEYIIDVKKCIENAFEILGALKDENYEFYIDESKKYFHLKKGFFSAGNYVIKEVIPIPDDSYSTGEVILKTDRKLKDGDLNE